jgi:hypothetical protein
MDHVPVRVKLRLGAPLHEVVRSTRDSATIALANPLPFSILLDALNPPRRSDHDPIFQVTFSFVGPRPVPEIPGCEVERRTGSVQIGRLFLNLNLLETDDHIVGVLEYAPGRFDRATAEQLAAHYVAVLRVVGTDPGSPTDNLRALFTE